MSSAAVHGGERSEPPPRPRPRNASDGRESWARYESEAAPIKDSLPDSQPTLDVQATIANMSPRGAGSLVEWVRTLPPELLKESGYTHGAQVLSVVRGNLHDADRFIADNGLTEDEAVAWAVWTVDAPKLYSRMCRLMREGDAVSLEEYHTWLWWLMKGAEKLPDHNGVVYRAHQGKGGVMAYTPGAKVHYTSFTACATRTTPQQLATFGRNNGLLIALDVVGAKRLGPLSVYRNEDEVVLLPGWVGTVGRWFSNDQRAKLGSVLMLNLALFNVVEVHQQGLPTDHGLVAADVQQQHRQRIHDAPGDFEALFQAALLCQCVGDFSVARDYYEDGLGLALSMESTDGSVVLAHINFALVLSHLRQYDEARQHLEAALELDPTHLVAHNNLANLLTDHFMQHRDAKDHFEIILTLDPTNINAHINLAVLLGYHFGGHLEAKHHYETVLAVDPNHVEARYNLGNLFFNHFAQNDEAKHMYESVLRLDPTHVLAHNNLAALLTVRYGQHDAAKVHYEAVLQLKPDDANTHNNLGVLLMNQFGLYEDAKRHLVTALDLQPNNVSAMINLGNLLSREFGRHDEGRRLLEAALRLEPNHATAHKILSRLLMTHYGQQEYAQYEVSRTFGHA